MQPNEIIGPILTGIVILAFVATFVLEAWRVWRSSAPPLENPALTYVWTAVSTLIGGVTAVVLNVASPAESGERTGGGGATLAFAQAALGSGVGQKFWLTVCTFAYVAVGIAAVATWILRQQSSTTLIRTASTTFVGLAIPVVAAFLGYVIK